MCNVFYIMCKIGLIQAGFICGSCLALGPVYLKPCTFSIPVLWLLVHDC